MVIGSASASTLRLEKETGRPMTLATPLIALERLDRERLKFYIIAGMSLKPLRLQMIGNS
jgi:hypothetical protein